MKDVDLKRYLLLEDYSCSKVTDYLLCVLGKSYGYYCDFYGGYESVYTLIEEPKEDCYLFDTVLDEEDGEYYIVLVSELNIPEFEKLKTFIKKEFDNNLYLYRHKIPDKYKEDVNKFIQGKYSYMSDSIKSLCKSLKIQTLPNGNTNPHYGILDRSVWFRKKLELYLNIKIDNKLDLRSLPTERDFYKTYFKNSKIHNINYSIV